jgi:hypothetical protein
VEPLQTPSLSHDEFDELCAEVGEFEPLPTVSSGALSETPDDEEDSSLNDQILVGLVHPV